MKAIPTNSVKKFFGCIYRKLLFWKILYKSANLRKWDYPKKALCIWFSLGSSKKLLQLFCLILPILAPKRGQLCFRYRTNCNVLLAENIKDDNILICFILYTYIKHQALSTREIDNNTYLTASSSCKSVSRSEAVVLFKSVSRSETVLSHK